ncbi:23S rRNA (adenine(2503)-C(2))-methyltransferase RlmN [Haliea sp. AH-315-K21]|uniref:Dual-specificity RNA methyltransferase RlmN n=1 Tax=SAR86 cluster bacterium TaxID=2030880 RepID=A0A2A5CBB7_9GAMM|nr:23S rRNA (adenine(2503)-C(2))-methyltransferase RlmN [Haliea sp. AH-315-K21]MBN4059772.1 23S rRNA (adenine(2503)-C(2))-methyltransferase RlmN [bacterium AH-315-I11]PCJ41149.1 MAG: 23S rRNA (adenine(2503)-C(2))-methyltransferase RlmN [SAR86 cluster bacterium]
MATQLTNLLGLSKTKMEAFLLTLGEKPFRAIQLVKWIHQQGVTDFDAMTNISKSLRASLKECAEIRPPLIKECYEAKDGCYKWIVEVKSGSSVEMVYIPEAGRGTLCISSQAGCSLDCKFCATGKQGFNSDLTAAEIIGQLWLVNQAFNTFGTKAVRKVTNVVMMGMGEPLMNFDNVMDAVGLMMEDNCYGLSKRRVTISTSGVVPKIYAMQEYTDASIAVSLHAPNDELRSEIVPINRKYPIKELLASVNAYLDSLTDKRVATIEYILISGVNDHRQHARELAEILQTTPCKINLIPFNPFEGADYHRSSDSAISNFRKILQDAGYIVTVRTTRGDDIGAACGQLVGQVDDTTRRSARHLAAREKRREQNNAVQGLKVQ